MNKFETIFNNVIEELATTLSLNTDQIKKDLERLPQQTKDVLQKISEPIESGTEKDPNEDLMKGLENLDFEKLPTDKKEKMLLILVQKGILNPEKNQQPQTAQTQQTNPASYGV